MSGERGMSGFWAGASSFLFVRFSRRPCSWAARRRSASAGFGFGLGRRCWACSLVGDRAARLHLADRRRAARAAARSDISSGRIGVAGRGADSAARRRASSVPVARTPLSGPQRAAGDWAATRAGSSTAGGSTRPRFGGSVSTGGLIVGVDGRTRFRRGSLRCRPPPTAVPRSRASGGRETTGLMLRILPASRIGVARKGVIWTSSGGSAPWRSAGPLFHMPKTRSRSSGEMLASGEFFTLIPAELQCSIKTLLSIPSSLARAKSTNLQIHRF